jgi:hypothetical protein
MFIPLHDTNPLRHVQHENLGARAGQAGGGGDEQVAWWAHVAGAAAG